MKSGGPAPILNHTPLELVHRFDRAVLHDIIDVPPQQNMRMQGVLNSAQQREIFLGKQILPAESPLDGADTMIGERDVAVVPFNGEIEAGMKQARHPVGQLRKPVALRLAARDHQRDASLVDQNRIGLVNERGGETVDGRVLPAGAPVDREENRSQFRSPWRK